MPPTNKTVLVVEDDDDARHLLTKMLQGMGHTVLAFPSGQEALTGITGQTFDIALLDVMMPEMNGYELLEKLKEIPDFASIPVIMVTARDQSNEILEGYSHGADYYITKPYTSKQIQYGINIVLDEGGS